MRNFLWMPWVGLVIVAGVIGGTLGLTGVFGHPTIPRVVITTDLALSRTADGYSCPGGSLVTKLQAHDRVLAVERSATSDYLGVRDPLNLGRVVWVHAADVSVNSKQKPIATLPVGSCPEVQSILMPPTNQGDTVAPPPAQPTKPTHPTQPNPPAPDATPPTVGTPTAGTPIVCTRNGSPPYTDTITVAATDNVGVTAVAITWTGAETGSGSMTQAAPTGRTSTTSAPHSPSARSRSRCKRGTPLATSARKPKCL